MIGFILIWGTKARRRREGYVADYCPLCRGVQPFEIQGVKLVSHLYYIPIGSGKPAGFEARCLTCGLLRGADTRIYTRLEKTLSEVTELTAKTNPSVRDRNRARVDLDKRIAAGKLLPEERTKVILEALAFVNPLVEQRGKQTQFDVPSGLGCLGTLTIPLAVFSLVKSLHVKDDFAVYGLMGTGAVLGLATVVLLATDVSRFTRRRVYPILARALRPLEPSREELDAAISQARAAKWLVAKKTDAGGLLAAIAALPA